MLLYIFWRKDDLQYKEPDLHVKRKKFESKSDSRQIPNENPKASSNLGQIKLNLAQNQARINPNSTMVYHGLATRSTGSSARSIKWAQVMFVIAYSAWSIARSTNRCIRSIKFSQLVYAMVHNWAKAFWTIEWSHANQGPDLMAQEAVGHSGDVSSMIQGFKHDLSYNLMAKNYLNLIWDAICYDVA